MKILVDADRLHKVLETAMDVIDSMRDSKAPKVDMVNKIIDELHSMYHQGKMDAEEPDNVEE